MADVIVPILHRNGDTAVTLSADLCRVYRAVKDAAYALRKTAPQGRNFQSVPTLFTQAQAQHQRRVQMLEDLQQEILAEQAGIEAQRRLRQGG